MRSSTILVLVLVLIPAAVAMANVLNHRVALKHMHGEVLVVEGEDGRSLYIYQARYGTYEVRTDEKGKPIEHAVAIGSYKHWDLNGDGTIDARYNGDTNVAEIWHQKLWVRVRHTKDGFQARKKRSDDGDDKYTFRNGKWIDG